MRVMIIKGCHLENPITLLLKPMGVRFVRKDICMSQLTTFIAYSRQNILMIPSVKQGLLNIEQTMSSYRRIHLYISIKSIHRGDLAAQFYSHNFFLISFITFL